MINQEGAGAAPGERAGAGDLGGAAGGLDPSHDPRHRRRHHAERLEALLELGEMAADPRRGLLPAALEVGAEGGGRRRHAVEEALGAGAVARQALADRRHHRPGRLGRRPGVVDGEAAEGGGAQSDGLDGERLGGVAGAPRPEQAAAQHRRRVDPRGRPVLPALDLVDQALDGREIRAAPRSSR